MTNKKIKRATGSYTQELVNNQPVMQQAVLRPGESSTLEKLPYKVGEANTLVQASAINPTVAAGGNSYQAYVNSGAPKTPVQTSSAVTPAQNPTVSMEGQYTRNLVKPKQMKNEVGGVEGVETGGEVVDTEGEKKEKGLEVENYPSYLETLKEREESIVDQYNADINYAEQLKADADKKAKDRYGIAMREAQANFRANQPTYGVAAEQLMGMGLTGSGYSDYLAGKAYEARTDEINAARSQQSYAQYLADSNYRDMMYQAEQDKFNRQYANDQWKLEYGVQLDAEYKAKVEEVLLGIINGTYNAAVGETILKNYAPNGEVSQNIINSLNTQEEKYWWNNNNSITTDFISWVSAMEADKQPVNAEGMRQWLKNNTNLTDDEVEFWISTYTDANGNYKPPTNISYEVRNGNLWISTDGGKTWKDYGALSDKGEVEIEGGDNDGNNVNNDNTGNSGTSTGESKNRWSGDEVITRGNARFKNDAMGSRTDLGDGDNFNITVNGKTYRVESGGELTDKTVLAALKDAGIEDGEVFSYGDQAFLKKNGKYYEIDTRVFRPNAEGNLVSSIGENTAAASNAENVGKHSYTTLAKASIWNSNAEPKVGKVLALETLDGKMRVKISSELGSDTAAYKAAVNDGIKDGQAFIHGEDVYVKKGDKVYMIAEDKKDYDSLKTYLNYNQNRLGSSAVKAVLNEVRDKNGKLISDKANVNINGISFKMTGVGKYHENDSLYKMFTDLGVKNGEMVLYNDKPYIYYNNSEQKMIGEYKYDGNIEELKKAFDPDVVAMPGVTVKSDVYDTVEGLPATTIEYLDKRATMLLNKTEGIDSQVYRKAEADGVGNGEIFVFGGNVYQYIKDVGCTMLIPYKDSTQIWEEIKKEINESGKNN